MKKPQLPNVYNCVGCSMVINAEEIIYNYDGSFNCPYCDEVNTEVDYL